jgi:hypothetical protein
VVVSLSLPLRAWRSGFVRPRSRVSTWFRPIWSRGSSSFSSELSDIVTVKNESRLVIFVATPSVDAVTCMRRYFMNVLLLHLPMSWIVSHGTPARNIAIAAPARFKCVPMLSTGNPNLLSPTAAAASHNCFSTSFDDIPSSPLPSFSDARALMPTFSSLVESSPMHSLISR